MHVERVEGSTTLWKAAAIGRMLRRQMVRHQRIAGRDANGFSLGASQGTKARKNM
jgi:hypothetical protein